METFVEWTPGVSQMGVMMIVIRIAHRMQMNDNLGVTEKCNRLITI